MAGPTKDFKLLFVWVTFLGICQHGAPELGQRFSPLKLRVDPPFAFVDEDYQVGKALPGFTVCADYQLDGPLLTLIVTSGDVEKYFRVHKINDTCWTLILIRQLDADKLSGDETRGQSFHLSFRCTDGRVQAHGNVDIQVLDLNDNAPLFVETPSAISVREDTEVGTAVVTLKTFDPDTGVGGIDSFTLLNTYAGTFKLTNGSCSNSKCTADLYLTRKLSYDLKNVYNLEIVAFDGAGRIQRINKVNFGLVINVLDVQNLPPRFLSDKRIYHVPEDQPLAKPIFQVQAVDGDTGVSEPHRIFYTILNEAARRFFHINGTSGWISLKRSLNREDPVVMANDGAFFLQIEAAEAPMESVVNLNERSIRNITVIVTDVGDEPPLCNLTHYVAQIYENSPQYTPISFQGQELYVYDNDEGPSGSFDIDLQDEHGIFDVTPKIVYNLAKPLIRVKNSAALDYEKLKSYMLKIYLKERLTKDSKSGFSGYCDIKLQILDQNDNAPYFEKAIYTTSALENQPAGTLVTQIQAHDKDSEKFLPIVYELSGTGSLSFLVNETGTIFTKDSLDREFFPVYNLTLTAIDSGGRGNRKSVPLVVTVIDLNDKPPIFTKQIYKAFAQENGYQFLQYPGGFFVKANDEDKPGSRNSNVTYSLDKSEDASYFQIHPISGELQIRPPGLDAESLPDVLNFSVYAQDNGLPRSLDGKAQIVIYVNDTNDNSPQFEYELYNATVHENLTSGSAVIKIHASDADRFLYNRVVAYRISTIQDKFYIDPQTGIVSLAEGASLNRDLTLKSSYQLKILALDQGYPQRVGHTFLEINVVDINDQVPIFPQKYYYTNVAENTPMGSIIYTLKAVDTDSNAELFYRIVAFEDPQDPDGQPVSLVMFDYQKAFGVKSSSGEVYLTDDLDRERMESITLKIEVTDVAGEVNTPQLATTFLKIKITDVNDSPPKFTKKAYTSVLSENSAVGTFVLSVSAKDIDRDHQITYQLGTIDNDTASVLALDQITGEVRVKGPIDFEKTRWLNFTIQAKDSAPSPKISTVPVFVKIMDTNDNSPVFELDNGSNSYKVSIRENSPPGTVVLTVTAKDSDSGVYGSVSYVLLEAKSQPVFAINSTSGEITVIGEVDRESQATHLITVQAIDNNHEARGKLESRISTVIVEVTVLDENDNPPQFDSRTPSTLTLNENLKAGAEVYTFLAQDADDPNSGNGVVRYFIASRNDTSVNSGNLFQIHAQTGVLTTAQSLSGNAGKTFAIIVEARDLGLRPLRSSHTLLISVEDFNDNPPQILQPKNGEVIPVAEHQFGPGVPFYQAKAGDPDLGLTANLTFSLKETPAVHDWIEFFVDPQSGNISFVEDLDRERQEDYYLTLRVCDNGQPKSLCSEVDFSVTLLDANDNCPLFEREKNFVKKIVVPENAQPSQIVGRFSLAIDLDTSAENAKNCYYVVGGTGKSKFDLKTSVETDIQVIEPLDREDTSNYTLIVQVLDCRGPKFCTASNALQEYTDRGHYKPSDFTKLLIDISVSDVNDNSPKFSQRLFRGGLLYNAKVGTRVTKLLATDPDIVDLGRLKFELLGPFVFNSSDKQNTSSKSKLPFQGEPFTPTPFIVNGTSGDIFTAIKFSPSMVGNFLFQASVKDLVGHVHFTNVSIYLLDFDQQVELVFEAPPHEIWKNSSQITKLISTLIGSESEVAINDIIAWQRSSSARRKPSKQPLAHAFTSQSRVFIHSFHKRTGQILRIKQVLRAFNLPSDPVKEKAKRELISVHNLKFASQHAGEEESSERAMSIYVICGAVIGGLVVLLGAFFVIYFLQSAIYKRRLKAASISSNNPIMHSVMDIPGTNIHANINPVWACYNYADGLREYDTRSTMSAHQSVVDDPNWPFQDSEHISQNANFKNRYGAATDVDKITLGSVMSSRAAEHLRAQRTAAATMRRTAAASPEPNFPAELTLESTEL